ncbi:MAG: UDP-glucose 4-epimerase GalE [Candidatus Omnitrophica bacterium]|nr:UDP-glucose 4-epimerase GalE [Candidatus Omnitrophota bacterium]
MAGMLVDSGHKVVVFDNLSTGVKPWVPKGAAFVKGELLNNAHCHKVFRAYPVSAVIHFAGRIVVPESIAEPVLYYRNNVGGTLNLLAAMKEAGVRRFVFSSTAAVYAPADKGFLKETSETRPQSPYGASKFMVEKILADQAMAGHIEFMALRYFNVAGWDTRRAWPVKGRPVPTHLISNIMRVLHTGGELVVCGNDYNTPDGTGIRDFIHVLDLCRAHLLSLKAMDRGIKNHIFNLGNEHGFSVMDIVKSIQKVASRSVAYRIGPRRPGDVATIVASSARARKILGWKPRYDLKTILKSEWERKF